MGAVPNIVAGLALGAMGGWLLLARRRQPSGVGAVCFVAAVCFLVNGAGALLGTTVALSVIAASGLWALGLRMLLRGPVRFGALALALIAAGTGTAAIGVLAVMQ